MKPQKLTNLYAYGTDVPVDRSRSEIEKILTRYGADSFAYGWEGLKAIIVFQMNNRRIKFVLPLPNTKDFSSQSGREKEERRRWRSLVLAIKSKLEVVASGISEFESEFMAHIVLPNGKTVGEVMVPQIEQSYAGGKMPPLLGPGGDEHN